MHPHDSEHADGLDQDVNPDNCPRHVCECDRYFVQKLLDNHKKCLRGDSRYCLNETYKYGMLLKVHGTSKTRFRKLAHYRSIRAAIYRLFDRSSKLNLFFVQQTDGNPRTCAWALATTWSTMTNAAAIIRKENRFCRARGSVAMAPWRWVPCVENEPRGSTTNRLPHTQMLMNDLYALLWLHVLRLLPCCQFCSKFHFNVFFGVKKFLRNESVQYCSKILK